MLEKLVRWGGGAGRMAGTLPHVEEENRGRLTDSS